MSCFSSDSQFEDFNPRQRCTKSRSRSRSPRRAIVKTKRIVIANIPYDMTWQRLKELFRERIGFTGFLQMFRSNGKPNGMGLMEFKTLEGAEKAIELMHRFEIGDRKLVVREENARDVVRIAQMEVEGQPSLSSDSALPSGDTYNTSTGNNSFNSQLLNSIGIDGPITDSIYISNLDYSVTWQKLKDVFKRAGRIVSAVVKTDSDGKSRGVGIVKFSTPYEALQAVNMFNNQILKDRPMRIKIDKQGIPAGNLSILGSTTACNPFNGLANNYTAASQPSANVASTLMALLGMKSGLDSSFQLPSSGIANTGNTGVYDLLRSLNMPDVSSASVSNASLNANAGLTLTTLMQLFSSISGVTQNSSLTNQTNCPANMGQVANSSSDAVQQLITAAIAGGMSQLQVANILSALGLTAAQTSEQYCAQLDSSSVVGRLAEAGLNKSRHSDDAFTGRSKYDQDSLHSYLYSPRGGNNNSGMLGKKNSDEFAMRSFANGRSQNLRSVDMNSSQLSENSTFGIYGQSQRRRVPEKLIIKNIPYSLKSHDLRRIFREIGEIRYCNLTTDPQGRSQGVAHLVYSDPQNYERAKSRFDGSLLDGRRIRLQID